MLSIVRLAIICFLIYLVYRLIKYVLSSPAVHGGDLADYQSREVSSEDLVEDPQCHIYIPLSQAYKLILDGRDIYFCSEKCAEQYRLENQMKKSGES